LRVRSRVCCDLNAISRVAWEETVPIVDRVRLALRPGGVLLCRLNSTEDRNFGADGYEEIEPGYFLVNGQPKRFFDEGAVPRLFDGGWNVVALEYITTDKYEKPKAAWEIVLETAYRSSSGTGQLETFDGYDQIGNTR